MNSIEWNYPGTKLCSVSDDCNIILWDPFKKRKLTQFHSNHTGNLFEMMFLSTVLILMINLLFVISLFR